MTENTLCITHEDTDNINRVRKNLINIKETCRDIRQAALKKLNHKSAMPSGLVPRINAERKIMDTLTNAQTVIEGLLEDIEMLDGVLERVYHEYDLKYKVCACY